MCQKIKRLSDARHQLEQNAFCVIIKEATLPLTTTDAKNHTNKIKYERSCDTELEANVPKFLLKVAWIFLHGQDMVLLYQLH